MDFKGNPAFADSFQASDKLDKIDVTDPTKEVIGNDSSLATLMQSFVNAQAQTNTNLIQFLGVQAANATGNITVDGAELTPAQQTEYLTDIASKQNLLSRQLEKSLQVQINGQVGIPSSDEVHLIHPPPKEWGVEQKVSDSGLKLINEFSGDTGQNEDNLNQFLRAAFAMAKTSNLSEQTTIALILRKLSGSAHELVQQFVAASGGPEHLQVRTIVHFLEKKFLIHCSPLSAETKLHGLKQGSLTYSQLQAQVQKLARLATRLDHSDQREAMTRIKESSAFLMSISNADRQYVNGENARRKLHNLPPMSLDQMSDFLLSHQADKLSVTERGQIQLAAEGESDPANMCQVQNYKQGENMRKNPHGPIHRSNGPKQQDKYNSRTQRKYNGQNPRDKVDRVFVTAAMAGVPHGGCLLCGDTSHTFRNDKCVYFGTDLMPSKCRHCHVGAHRHVLCTKRPGKQQTDPQWPRAGRF